MKKTLPSINLFRKFQWLYGFALVLILNFAGGEISFAQGSVGIGTATPNASAALDIVATNKGVLVPRLTVAQRDAIAAPASGLLVYNSEDLKFNYWDGAKWVEVGEGLTWYTGQGVPADMGKVNDLYLDEQTGDIYQRVYDSLNPLVLIWSRFNFNKNNKKQVSGTSTSIGAFSATTLTFPFPGVGTNNAVVCSPMFDLANGIVISQAWVSAPNVVTVKFFNANGSAATLNAGNYQIAIF